ncbi:MAG: hypothetical protein ABIF10_03105 [Candidatus Woesearchaeota archaeon]
MAKDSSESAKKYLKIVFGLLLILGGLGSYLWWWPDLWILFKGSIGLIVGMIGLVFILIGASD